MRVRLRRVACEIDLIAHDRMSRADRDVRGDPSVKAGRSGKEKAGPAVSGAGDVARGPLALRRGSGARSYSG